MKRFTAAVVILVAPVALAVSTSFWVVSTQEEFLKGKSKGVAISSEGTLVPGLSLEKMEIKADAVWSLLPRKGGTYLLGTGNKGRVLLYDGREIKEVADTQSLAVTALADDGNGLILAAAMPNGHIYRLIPEEGGTYKSELFARMPAQYVWALVFSKKDGNFYAATGPEGQVYRLSTEGAVTLWLNTKETHILSLLCDADGVLYAGTAPRGLVLSVPNKNSLRVLYDCAEEEVWRLALSADGVVACANKAAQEGAEQPVPPEQGKEAPKPSSGSLPTHSPTAFSVYRVRKDGGAVRIFGQEGAFTWQAAVDGMGRILVATADNGRIFRVEADGTGYETLAELESKAVAAIGMAAGEPALFAGNNPVALYKVVTGENTGEYTSSVFDAGFTASWGRVGLRGRGKVFFQARSGQTTEVDDTWSQWSASTGLEGGPVLCPRARYIQFRITLEGPESALEEVRLPFLVDNQRPEIEALSVVREGSKDAPGQEQSKNKDGNRIETTIPKPHSPKIEMEWKAQDSDGDPLIFRLYFRYPGALTWMPLTREHETLKEPKYSWDTTGLPEGRYAVKLVASDEQNNPPGIALSAVKLEEPVVVDNTPPEVLNLRVENKILLASATDGTSRIIRMTIQVNSEQPRLVFPEDGIYDEKSETVKVDLASLVAPGEHILTLYAVDAEGNQGSASLVTVIVP